MNTTNITAKFIPLYKFTFFLSPDLLIIIPDSAADTIIPISQIIRDIIAPITSIKIIFSQNITMFHNIENIEKIVDFLNIPKDNLETFSINISKKPKMCPLKLLCVVKLNQLNIDYSKYFNEDSDILRYEKLEIFNDQENIEKILLINLATITFVYQYDKIIDIHEIYKFARFFYRKRGSYIYKHFFISKIFWKNERRSRIVNTKTLCQKCYITHIQKHKTNWDWDNKSIFCLSAFEIEDNKIFKNLQIVKDKVTKYKKLYYCNLSDLNMKNIVKIQKCSYCNDVNIIGSIFYL